MLQNTLQLAHVYDVIVEQGFVLLLVRIEIIMCSVSAADGVV